MSESGYTQSNESSFILVISEEYAGEAFGGSVKTAGSWRRSSPTPGLKARRAFHERPPSSLI